jgi:hypothetical protein
MSEYVFVFLYWNIIRPYLINTPKSPRVKNIIFYRINAVAFDK